MPHEPLLASRVQKFFIATSINNSSVSLTAIRCFSAEKRVTEAIAVLVLVAIVFRKVEQERDFTDGLKTLPCYLALFALGEVFELLMAFDALRMRNVIQLFGMLLFHLAMTVYAAVQIPQTRDAIVTMSASDCDTKLDLSQCDVPGSLWRSVEGYLIAAPIVMAVAWFAIVFWTKALYEEFGWAIFHVAQSFPTAKMKTMYQIYQIMLCLLKFDFFFFTGVTMQLLILVLNRDSAEFGITISAIPVCALASSESIHS
ncbi:hypothetical protein PM082_013042 [Marasmius tenuissimus]|nr:hypothetical protein PM082_013042 [Marasmius tenuissimus]